MAPKKLTDCPENLREAIDWLIQVRHGGNKDGKNGLDELAKALKKLIEEAIQKAYTTNFDALLNILNSVKSYTCCKDKVAKIEALKDPKTLAKNTFNDLKNNCEGIRDCYKSHLESSQQKSYDEIRSKLDQLGKLKDSLSGFTNEEEYKDLLTHLCDGLQTFLGFNSETKGYDGKGIVYSDLDRLCDAVMGFLSGVLGAVKDDEAVKTYDKDIRTGNLSSVLTKLQSQIGSGREGLAVSVDAVKEWLEGYGNTMTENIRHVNDNITQINIALETQKNLIKHRGSESFKIVDDALTNFITATTTFLSKLIGDGEAIRIIDSSLKIKLNDPIHRIRQAIDAFKKSAKNKDLQQLNKLAICELKKMDKDINEEIARMVTDMENEVNYQFVHQLWMPIEEVNSKLTTVRTDLDAWIKGAIETVKKAIKKSGDILKRVDESDAKNLNTLKIKQNAEMLQQKITKLLRAYRSAHETVTGLRGQLVGTLVELETSMKADLVILRDKIINAMKQHVIELGKALQGSIGAATEASYSNTGPIGVTSLATALQGSGLEALEKNLRSVAERNPTLARHIHNALHYLQQGRGMRSGDPSFDSLENSLKQGLDGLIEKKLKEYIPQDGTDLTREFDTIMGKYREKTTRDTDSQYQMLLKAIPKAMDAFTTGAYASINEAGAPGAEEKEASKQLETIQAELSAISHFIDRKKNWPQSLGEKPTDPDGIKDHLDELLKLMEADDKYIFTKGLKAIENRINIIINGKSANTLNSVLLNMNGFYTSVIRTQADNAITNIKSFVENRVDIITNQLNNESQRLYANRKQQELHSLKKIVETEKLAIEAIIKYDKENGLKGFLGKLKGKNGKDIETLKTAVPESSTSGESFKNLATEFKSHLQFFFEYIGEQVKTPLPPKFRRENECSDKVSTIHGQLNKLLRHFGEGTKSYNFDHTFADLLGNLKTSICDLSPTRFDGHHNTLLLDATKAGLDAIYEQLYKAYVNAYAGQPVGVLLSPDDKLTPEGTKLSKVFLTILTLFKHAFDVLNHNCDAKGAWKDKMISLVSKPNIHNPLGAFLEKCGFVVSRSENSHDGELRCHKQTTGSKIHGDIVSSKVSAITTPPLVGTIDDLHDCLEKYNEVGHVLNFSAKRQPCSVYEMLIWLGGLTYTSVYSNMLGIPLSDLFEDPNKDKAEGNTATLISEVTLDAQPSNIRYNDVVASINDICAKSYDVLITIAGTGDSETTYASDFCNNSMRFHYPASGEECLEMLIDMLRRLLPALKYLFNQCNINAEDCGWANCLYGKAVSTSNWQCKNHSTDKPKCRAKCDSKIQPTCQPRSPLMSHLNDCLPGHLPHKLNSIGCKVKCSTCPKSTPGMPCLTPLGFKQFSGSTKTGRELCEMLRYFLGAGTISSLLSLVPRPPSSLPEHFGFALSLVSDWKRIGSHPLRDVFQSCITSTSIRLCKDPQALTNALKYAYGRSQVDHGAFHAKRTEADLSSLSMSSKCTGQYQCGPYLYALHSDAYTYKVYNHSDHYLSWAIYLPWTFWDLLNNLYNAFCSINCQDWGCRGCLRGDKCKKGDHGSVHDKTKESNCQCSSIVDCKGVAPTLYQYGFVFGEASTLNDKISPKKCSDFCSQLKNVLKSKYFEKLFEECDNFLWKIREPFSYLVLALWLLSLLYLFHIFIIRLDLLHIKSHLRSPSSHRIAAQSLLAAARVGQLAKLTYLQP